MHSTHIMYYYSRVVVLSTTNTTNTTNTTTTGSRGWGQYGWGHSVLVDCPVLPGWWSSVEVVSCPAFFAPIVVVGICETVQMFAGGPPR